jgi:hypothetical protein
MKFKRRDETFSHDVSARCRTCYRLQRSFGGFCQACKQALALSMEAFAESFYRRRPGFWGCVIDLCGLDHPPSEEPASFTEKFNHYSREGHAGPHPFVSKKLVCRYCYNIVLSVTRMARAASGEACGQHCRRSLPVKNAFNCKCACVGARHGELRAFDQIVTLVHEKLAAWKDYFDEGGEA